MESTLEINATHNSWWRLLGVVLEPSSTFHEIDKKPTWILALLGATAVRLGRVFLFYNPSRTPVKLVLTGLVELISTFIPIVVCSGVFLLALYLGGAKTTFKKVFSVLCHTFFFYTVINVILSSIMLWTSDRRDVDLQNPVVSNLGFLFNKQDHLALNYLASSLDALVVYHMFLIVLGLSIVAKKTSLKSVTWTVISSWGLYTIAVASVKALVG